MTARTTNTKAGRAPRRNQKTGSLSESSEREIRARAHEIYLARADGPGDAMSDWIQAERELSHTMSAT